jgi:hypothetical protein
MGITKLVCPGIITQWGAPARHLLLRSAGRKTKSAVTASLHLLLIYLAISSSVRPWPFGIPPPHFPAFVASPFASLLLP